MCKYNKYIEFKLANIKSFLHERNCESKYKEVQNFIYSEYNYWSNKNYLFDIVDNYIRDINIYSDINLTEYLKVLAYSSIINQHYPNSELVYLVSDLLAMDNIINTTNYKKLLKIYNNEFDDKFKDTNERYRYDNKTIISKLDMDRILKDFIDLSPDRTLKLKYNMGLPLSINLDMKDLTSIFYSSNI